MAPDVKLSTQLTLNSHSTLLLLDLTCFVMNLRTMYERHKRRYSLCAKGERAVDVVLIKVGFFLNCL